MNKLWWASAGVAALVLLGAASSDAAAQGAPVPDECRLPGLSAAEQARCDFIARTPDLCERPNLSAPTRTFCETLRADEDDCRLSERTCAAEGVVLIARHADRLVIWRRTDLRAFSLRWFRPRLLDGLGSAQTVTLLVGPEDLDRPRLERLAQLVYERGGAVIVTDATLDDADRLRQLLGVSGAAWGPQMGTARLYGLREVAEDGRRLSFVLFSDPERGALQFRLPLDPSETAWLLDRIGPNPPGPDTPAAAPLADAMANLYDLAAPTVTSLKSTRGGQSLEVDNSVISGRALDETDFTDFYAVDQQVVGIPCADQTAMSFGVANGLNVSDPDDFFAQQALPHNVASGASYQTGVDFPFSASAEVGYPKTTSTFSGFDVAPGNAEIVFSKTTDLPAGASIALQTNPLDWQLTASDPPTAGITMRTSWLWEAPGSAYPNTDPLMFDAASTAQGQSCSALPVAVTLTTSLDRPFPTPSAEAPVIANNGIVPGSVTVNEQFSVNGTGFYPSILTAVQVGGMAVTDFTVDADTLITVTAPTLDDSSLYGLPLAVEVDTTSGPSNSDQNVVITN